MININTTNRTLIILLLFCLTGPMVLKGQPKDTQNMKKTAYPEDWKHIDSLIKDGLVQSALEAVSSLQKKARKDQQQPDVVKAIVFQNSLQANLSETPFEERVKNIQEYLENTTGLEQSLLQFMLAKTYEAYLSENYWRLEDLTEVKEGASENWQQQTPAQLQTQIINLYLSSLKTEALKKTPAQNYALLWQNENASSTLRPTLFDVLSHQVINYLKDARSYLTSPEEKFLLSDSVYFAAPEVFLQQDFSKDNHSPLKAQTLQLFQDLLSFRLTQNDFSALIDLDRHRLEFVWQRSNINRADDLYLSALNRLIKKYGYQSGMGSIHLEKAKRYYAMGQDYSSKIDEKNKRWKLQETIQLCQALISALPESKAAEKAKELIASIKEPYLELTSEKVLLPEQAALAKISFKNLNQAFLKVVELDFETQQSLIRQNRSDAAKWVAALPAPQQWQSDLPNADDHRLHSIETKIPGLKPGQYALVFSDQANFDTTQQKAIFEYYPFSVSTIAYLSRNDTEGKTNFVLTHRKTGAPLVDVEATLYTVNYDYQSQQTTYTEVRTLHSDDRGFIKTEVPDRAFIAKFAYQGDSLFVNESFYNGRQYERDESYLRTAFFLDRAIYRPGQIVHFKGIVTQHNYQDATSIAILPEQKVEVVFRDVNYQEIKKQSFTTNEFGTFNGKFIIPESILTGTVTLYADLGGSTRFQVEEYKRPKFKVNLDPLEGDFSLGDRVNIEGSAQNFAGSMVDNAEVVFRVTRQDLQPFPWYRYSYPSRSYPGYGQETEIANGRTRTDSTGGFSLEFTALPNPDIPASQRPRFRYQVQVDVIDITGETQSTSRSFTLAYTGWVARLEIPEEMDRSTDSLSWRIITENHEGSPLEKEGILQIYQLTSPVQVFKDRYWNSPTEAYPDSVSFREDFPLYALAGEDQWQNWPKELIREINFSTAKSNTIIFPPKEYQVGHYLVLLTAKDEAGNEIDYTQRFQIVDTESRQIPENLLFWNQHPLSPLQPGQEFRMELASNKVLNILLEMERQGELIRQEWVQLEDWNQITKMIEETDRGNLQVQLSYIFENRAHTEMINVMVPYSNKDLNFEYSTFRDKLRPGQEEEWNIVVSGDKKEEVAAEMVVTLYDSSLDQFVPHQWQLQYFNSSYRLRFPWRPRLFSSTGIQTTNHYSFNDSDLSLYPYLNLYLEEDMLLFHREPIFYLRSSRSAEEEVSSDQAMTASAAPPPPPPPAPELAETKIPEENSGIDLDQKKPVEPQIRTNLNETVFFHPELRTDENGNIRIKFKMNEALTSWKFMGFAHTKDLKTGLTVREIITQKELMVLPNPPRFVREGDQFEFSAKVSNLTDQTINGEASIQFFDPITQKEVTDQLLSSLNLNEQPFSAKAGQSDRLAWPIEIPHGKLNALTYRIIARSAQFSDGEENSLPVLSNRVLVTETMPISLRSKEKKSLGFTAMQSSLSSNTAQGHLFQLDFTSNPVWLAVKSLPYLMEYPYDCSEQIFNRYYANSIAGSILDHHPSINQVFKRWKNTKATSSNLEQQEALKSALLEETPWVLAAQSEAEQRKRLALLFDLDRLRTTQEKTLYQLLQGQNNDGSFSWFNGGNGNWYITNYIIAGFGHLKALGVLALDENDSTAELVQEALAYSEQQFIDRYHKLQELAKAGQINLKDNHLSPSIVHYLYAKSFFLTEEEKTDKSAALQYFLEQTKRFWNQTNLYQQGQIGLLAQRMDIPQLSRKILSSLKERALQSEELGMYWKYQNGYSWHQSPIESQAIMIEFFSEMGETELLDELKIWLLKNKQTNAWPTTKNTAEAIWALLSTAEGSSLLMEDKLISIKFPELKKADYVGKMASAKKIAEAGTGQFEVAWKGETIKKELATITVKNPNRQIAWGAAYWQYFEDLDQVKVFQETPLTLNKQLYLSINTPQGPQLSPITSSTSVHPGDLITVRIVLTVDRDMEFIHLKDMRASGLEPINVLSRYRWQGGLGYYESTRDLATHFFFDYLPKGTYTFEYPLRVQLNGDFTNGICTIQSMYAPEFTSHSQGTRLKVIEK